MGPDDQGLSPRRQRNKFLVLLIGCVLALIGIRFLVAPEGAVITFGLAASQAESHSLHAVIGLRDIWLGLLAVVFALLHDWRALAVWLGLGAGVCLGDAAIVLAAGGPHAAIAFHGVSGLLCAGLGRAMWHHHHKGQF